MRVMYFLIAMLFFACGDPSSSASSKPSNPTAVSTSSTTQGSTSSTPTKPGENPDIKITIQGGPASGQVQLIGMFNGENYLIDKGEIQPGGIIHFKKGEPYRQGLAYVVLADNTNFQFLITEDQTFNLTCNVNDPTTTMKVEGSLDNQLLYDMSRFESDQRAEHAQIKSQKSRLKEGTPEYDALEKKTEELLDARAAYLNKLKKEHSSSFFTAFKLAGQNPDMRDIPKEERTADPNKFASIYRKRLWQDVNFNDERLMWTPVISTKLKRYMTELTVQNPDSIFASAKFLIDQVLDKPEYFKYFANWVTLQYEPTKTTLMDAEAVYVNMIKNYFTKERAFWSEEVEVVGLQKRAYEMGQSLVGQQGPDVISKDLSGNEHSIYGMKSDYILVYMFNPDCEHCAVETPKLVANYKSWKAKGIDVYGIAIDTDEQKLGDYIKKNQIPFNVVYDSTNRSIYAKYYVNITPELYVLNKERKIIGKNLNVDQVMTIIDRDKKG